MHKNIKKLLALLGSSLILFGAILTYYSFSKEKVVEINADPGGSGAIWTTSGSCGSPQNVNHYPAGSVIYINGDNFTPNPPPAAPYSWDISDPGNNGNTYLSGTVVAAAPTGSFCIAAGIVPSGGPYQVKVNGVKGDNFSVDAPTPSPTPTRSSSPTPTPTPTPTQSPTASPRPTDTPTPTLSPTSTPTPTSTASPIPTDVPGQTPSPTPTPTDILRDTPTPTASPTESPAPSSTSSATNTPDTTTNNSGGGTTTTTGQVQGASTVSDPKGQVLGASTLGATGVSLKEMGFVSLVLGVFMVIMSLYGFSKPRFVTKEL